MLNKNKHMEYALLSEDTVQDAVDMIHAASTPQLADDFVDYCEHAARAIEAEGAAYLAKAKRFDERCITLAATIRDVAVHHARELERAAIKADNVTRGLQLLMDEFHAPDDACGDTSQLPPACASSGRQQPGAIIEEEASDQP